MIRKRGKMIALKGVLAICLLINNFSSFGAVSKAATVESENIINSEIIGDLTNKEETLPEIYESEEVLPGDNSGDEKEALEMSDNLENVEEENENSGDETEAPEMSDNLENVKEENENPEDISDEGGIEKIDLAELEEAESLPIENRSSGSGLVQLWQVVPDGQTSEGKTTSEIMKALQCRPNHNLYPSGGQSEHNTYVNSCYVDDALYLGEEANYYKIYLSGYEGKVPKSQSHWFELDLNNDGVKVKYEIQTVAYYIPGGASTYNLQETTEPLEVPELNYNNQYLDKYNDIDEEIESGITVFSTSTVQSPSYYANEGGTLIHYLTNNVTKANSYSKVTVGKAPSWMNSGIKYYSYDGIYFYTNWRNIKVNGQGAVNQSNPFYNYYQYLPFRSKSNYSANIFDSYTNSNGGAGGKLVNTGQYFYAVQDNYGINGGLQYAMGIHESGWGKSSLSLNKNNLFGMNATDNNPYGNGTSFPSVEAGINYHADRYLSWGYTDPISDWRYMGSHVGNKGSGMNVRYASDPFWGEKIAGWYYRFDSASGLRDYDYYSIGIKQSNMVVDVKSQASSSSSTLYQTMNKNSNIKISNYPVLITGKQNGFYKIKTDTPINNQGLPQYNITYNWQRAYGYINADNILIANDLHFNNSDIDLALYNDIEPILINENGIIISGFCFIEKYNMINLSDIKKTLLIRSIDGNIIEEVQVQNVYRDDVTQSFGQGKYNYDYAGYNILLSNEMLNKLNDGEYYLEFKIELYENISLYFDFSTNKIQNIKGNVNKREVQLYNPEKVILNLNSLTNNNVGEVKIEEENIKISGWSIIQGVDFVTDEDHQKEIVIRDNITLNEVYRSKIKATSRKDVTNALGENKYNYDYAGYEAIIPKNIFDRLEGTYVVSVEMKKGELKKEAIGVGVINTIETVGNKLIQIKTDESNLLKISTRSYETDGYIGDIEVKNDSIVLNGWSTILDSNLFMKDTVGKELVLHDTKGNEITRIDGTSTFRADVTQAMGKNIYNYDYTGYEFNLDLELIKNLLDGDYNISLFNNIGEERVKMKTKPASNPNLIFNIDKKQVEIKIEESNIYLKIK